jgi:hypothetical protein
MSVRDTTSRLQRLEELKGLLGAREHITATELAAELASIWITVKRSMRF